MWQAGGAECRCGETRHSAPWHHPRTSSSPVRPRAASAKDPSMELVLPALPTPIVPIQGQPAGFPVRRIYCVGRNYVEHAKEMGHSGREPPFFFMKPADAIVPVAGGTMA